MIFTRYTLVLYIWSCDSHFRNHLTHMMSQMVCAKDRPIRSHRQCKKGQRTMSTNSKMTLQAKLFTPVPTKHLNARRLTNTFSISVFFYLFYEFTEIFDASKSNRLILKVLSTNWSWQGYILHKRRCATTNLRSRGSTELVKIASRNFREICSCAARSVSQVSTRSCVRAW